MKLYGDGASAADFRQTSVSVSTLFSILQADGFCSSMDAAIQSQSSAISSFDPSTINSSSFLAQIQKFFPSVQLPAVANALTQITSTAAQYLRNL